MHVQHGTSKPQPSPASHLHMKIEWDFVCTGSFAWKWCRYAPASGDGCLSRKTAMIMRWVSSLGALCLSHYTCSHHACIRLLKWHLTRLVSHHFSTCVICLPGTQLLAPQLHTAGMHLAASSPRIPVAGAAAHAPGTAHLEDILNDFSNSGRTSGPSWPSMARMHVLGRCNMLRSTQTPWCEQACIGAG